MPCLSAPPCSRKALSAAAPSSSKPDWITAPRHVDLFSGKTRGQIPKFLEPSWPQSSSGQARPQRTENIEKYCHVLRAETGETRNSRAPAIAKDLYSLCFDAHTKDGFVIAI